MQSHSKMWIILLTRASRQRFSHKQSRPCSHILIDNMLKLTLFKDGLAHRDGKISVLFYAQCHFQITNFEYVTSYTIKC